MGVSSIPEIYVVLVQPLYPGNVGSVARAMLNFGFRNLILVDPTPLDDEAYRMAKHARGVLESALILDEFEDVFHHVDYLAGTSGVDTRSDRKFNRISLTPREFASRIAGFDGRVGIAFGRENYGLYNHELERCDALVKVPTSDEYPVMNISHAVAVILYEMSMAMGVGEGEERPLASKEEYELMVSRFERLLDLVDYPAHKKKRTVVMFRRLLGRAVMTRWEYHALMGVFSDILQELESDD